ncbi:Uncharacterized protein Fot_13142 [Forsythia ovata]|uniref:Uncharacterized protein n=1 Tax=Forsythia ovata TaxID=205694 RepID=A0ABD1W2M4_9LAMI
MTGKPPLSALVWGDVAPWPTRGAGEKNSTHLGVLESETVSRLFVEGFGFRRLKELETLDVLKELETIKNIVEELKLKLQKETLEINVALNANTNDKNVNSATEMGEKVFHDNYMNNSLNGIGVSDLCPSSAPGFILLELKLAKFYWMCVPHLLQDRKSKTGSKRWDFKDCRDNSLCSRSFRNYTLQRSYNIQPCSNTAKCFPDVAFPGRCQGQELDTGLHFLDWPLPIVVRLARAAGTGAQEIPSPTVVYFVPVFLWSYIVSCDCCILGERRPGLAHSLWWRAFQCFLCEAANENDMDKKSLTAPCQVKRKICPNGCRAIWQPSLVVNIGC